MAEELREKTPGRVPETDEERDASAAWGAATTVAANLRSAVASMLPTIEWYKRLVLIQVPDAGKPFPSAADLVAALDRAEASRG